MSYFAWGDIDKDHQVEFSYIDNNIKCSNLIYA